MKSPVEWLGRVGARLRPLDGLRRAGPWAAYVAVALACGLYLNWRAELVPKWGEWWAADPHAYVYLQVRAFLSGRVALLPHPGAAAHDYFWGRGGMHTAWGLGVPILAIPFHLVGRLFGAPGCPDSIRFLILYAMTAVVLARALHGLSRYEARGLGASCAAAAFVMTFPTYVGMVSSRFQIYEQTIAIGALWSVLLLAGVLALLRRCTPARLFAVCAAAGFIGMIRIPIAFYGPTTAAIAVLVAHRRGLSRRVLVAGAFTYVGFASLYFLGNVVRFGGLLNSGYENCLCSAFPNRLTRWGLPFAKVPFMTAAKEMFATLFLLEPAGTQMFGPPPEVARYAVGERWREYYSPTFDLYVLGLWGISLAIVGWGTVRGKLWRRDRELAGDAAAVVGAWAIPPSVVLFAFYTKIPNMCTRYASDLYPAFAASSLCVGMFIVDAVRKRAPPLTEAAHLGLAGVAALYIASMHGWVVHLSRPINGNTLIARIGAIDALDTAPPHVPSHFKCGEPRGPQPVHTHFDEWWGDCSFASGMVFAMPHSPCVTFTFGPGSGAWGPLDDAALAHFRVNGDFDRFKTCGEPSVKGAGREVTLCETRSPPFLLDGLRLYTIGALDEGLHPMDRLKLLQIDASSSCK